jgi:hypothetical protein
MVIVIGDLSMRKGSGFFMPPIRYDLLKE